MFHKLVFVDRASLPVSLPGWPFAIEYQEYPSTSAAELVARCAEAEIVITNKVPFTREVLAQLPKLRLIAISATGYNHIDLDYCREHQIGVCNIRHYGDDAVAEHAFMLMQTLMRNLPAYQRDVAAGLWSKSQQFCHFGAPIRDLKGATLGIIGGGGIGQTLAKLAQAFGMKVLFAERKGSTQVRAGYQAFTEVLAQADAISLHCPLNAETHHLIAQPELMAMKPGAVLINTSRGGLVDETALVAALKYGQLGGAGFDVLVQEPPPEDNPLLKAHLPNLIVTPHVAWASQNAMATLAAQLVDNIAAFVVGREQNRLV